MSSPAPRLHVAVTVEQAWQPVPGGSGTYVAALTRELAGLADVTGLAAWHRRPAPADWAPTGRVRRVPLPRVALYEAWQRVRLPRAEWSVPAADVVHATTWAVPPTRRPLVVTVHDLAFLADPEHFTARGAAFFRRALDDVRRRADAVVVPSATTRDECLAAGIEESRLHVVPHGTDVRPAAPQDVDRFRDRHGLARPYVLWVGTREPRKNLRTVLAAHARAAGTTGTELVLVGPRGWGDTGLDDAPPGVRVLGALDRSELDAAYTGARAFCFPSYREGFGLPVLEGMAAGVPVVTSAGTACADVAGDAALLVDPADADAVADALVEACGERHDALATASTARARQFSWRHAAERTLEVYASTARR
ncbi:glycosyltransferase family 4 protein [Cellulomonas fimi]|uniref:glycosyltransferase family 4 protein n=1 Tax=Cellulomonas fimi TaxID=1708 RepID=UPI00234CDBB3|nr:glycosyltransferase family 1 protein [Cellulomonas fimi]MDC7122975.1 glycosyltransferase family 4 protein [Cellulomonas fimi]